MGGHVHSADGPQDCYGCRIKGVNLGFPRDFPSRTRSKAPPRGGGNNWEKGIARDERGMPFLTGPDLHEMGVKEAAEKRHLIEETRRRRRNDPNPLVPTDKG